MKNSSFSSLTKYLRFFTYGERLRPARDWFVLVSITFLLLLASVAWNVWLFIELANGQSIIATSEQKQTPMPTVSVTGAQEVFQERATEETNYQNTYHFVDPSTAGS